MDSDGLIQSHGVISELEKVTGFPLFHGSLSRNRPLPHHYIPQFNVLLEMISDIDCINSHLYYPMIQIELLSQGNE